MRIKYPELGMSLEELGKSQGVSKQAIAGRQKHGWTIEEILNPQLRQEKGIRVGKKPFLWEGKTYKEIAELTKLTPQTVRLRRKEGCSFRELIEGKKNKWETIITDDKSVALVCSEEEGLSTRGEMTLKEARQLYNSLGKTLYELKRTQ